MKSSLVSIAISVASPDMRSRTGRQKVPTPGPYSTNSLLFFQSTGRSMWRISVGDDGTIDPTMTGCLIKPRTNMPHGPKKRLRPTRSRRTSGAFVCWACARGLVMMAFALLRLAKAWQNRDGRARKESVLTLDRRAPACREKRHYRLQKTENRKSGVAGKRL